MFIPVGLNYDRVLEDRSLLLKVEPRSEAARKASGVATALRFAFHNLVLMARGRWHRFGYACVNFGTPISMRAHVRRAASISGTCPPRRVTTRSSLWSRI